MKPGSLCRPNSKFQISNYKFFLVLLSCFPLVSHAGDILRGGATSSSGSQAAAARANAGAAAASLASAKAQDRLARTTKAINDMRALQVSARAAAGGVPDGLVTGGLERLSGGTWSGAALPTQSGYSVNIKQTASQALLDWKTFNVGSGTTVTFDQTSGGNDSGKWIAFNKVFDPSGVPSQIRGQIKADGQVYIINQNGIIFGAGSQVNTRTLVASSLPINDRLLEQGLLNNKDAQFLFSSLDVPGGADGTRAFIAPPRPSAATEAIGVVVEQGATISGPTSSDGNGGRVMLVGANVRNDGTISTPSGQTILAAGLQVGVQAHNSSDPSLRGLDVWVGSVESYGSAVNNGLIESRTGSVTMAGRVVNQSGIIDSSTSVNLNGRIDLIASYGATANPNYDNITAVGGGGPIFLNQFTGSVAFGPASVTRILPDYASTEKIPGTSLPENSQINVQGLSIQMQGSSILLAPHADVSFRAGTWTYVDVDSNHTIFKADGTTVEDALVSNFSGGAQRLFYSGGQIFLDSGSLLDVSGSTDVFVPLAQHILSVQFRGSELADFPLQRNSVLRGKKLVVDIRRSGQYGGRQWLGSPLGDLTGVAGIIQRDVAQLTAGGGKVNIQSGGSIAVQQGATVDVSGGYFKNEGGVVQTSRLLRNGYLVDIAKATPDVKYDGVYDGKTTVTSSKWGVSKTFSHALAPLGAYSEKSYIEGANGGAVNFTAPSIIVGGNLVGQTITGPKQLIPPSGSTASPATPASLSFTFKAEARYVQDANTINYYETSPTPPETSLTADKPGTSAFVLAPGGTLPTSLTSQFAISTTWWDEGGFGSVSIDNPDGTLTLPSGVDVRIPAGGSLTAKASNITIGGTITAPGGAVSLTAFNYSPYDYQRLVAIDPLLNTKPALGVVAGRGIITLGATGKLDVSGMLVDDRPTSGQTDTGRRLLNGGTVTMEGYTINLSKGSLVDASGGVRAKPVSGFEYGNGGAISILAGRDPGQASGTPTALLIGGGLALDGTLAAYSAKQGGSLAIRANLIQVGGQASDPTMLVLAPEFFRGGGFTSYSLTGIGKASGAGYIPAIRVVDGAVIEPVAENLILSPYRNAAGFSLAPILKPVGERSPVSITMAATGADDPFTTGILEARGDIVIGKGSVIRTDPGASVLIGTDANLKKTLADTVAIYGTIEAPGGTIAIFTRNKFRLAPDVEAAGVSALPTVYIGPDARISAAGTVVPRPDPFGRRIGTLYSGGTISLYGNIVAESGAVLDVSGASGIFDIHPSLLTAAGQPVVPATSGLNTLPYKLQTVATRVDSNGGILKLQGAQMLLSDATLLGSAGGPTAVGGTLSIFSGRYYAPGASRTSADINLTVSQSGQALSGAPGSRGIGIPVRDSLGTVVPGMGFFAADRFQQGGFASLDLGFKFLPDASPIPYGGNVQFVGPVSISASGSLRVAGGGIILANSSVNLSASYIAVGQEIARANAVGLDYPAPLNPSDPAFVAFQQDPPPAVGGATYFPQPSYGTGTVNFTAKFIDIGTTVFQNTGSVAFTAAGGDIRGSGTLSLAGDLTLTAGQIYPGTLAAFNIFAYDHAGGTGSVTIKGSGTRPMPYSAGGSLNIFASTITQGGTLRAPFGSINLGWDGTDYNLSTAAFDSPVNPVVGSGLTVPIAQTVVLGAASTTSVSAVDPATGVGLKIPFGLSPDGLSWIDPRGVNVTVSGLPQKSIAIAGNNVVAEAGSVIDIRGGGDLLAYRWVSGTGGSQDLLGEAGGEWGAGATYAAGDLVTYKGETWSARVAIDPAALKFAPSPTMSAIYWSKVDTSYAILPGYAAEYAPSSAYNTGANALALGGDPGLTSSKIKLGDRVFLDGIPGLAAGTYTLLPKRYALLPGAFLVTPKSTGTFARFTTAEGAATTSGYIVNAFSQPSRLAGIRSLFEIASPAVIAGRAEYEVLGANEFIQAAAGRLNVTSLQHLPVDSGSLAFQGNTALRLEGAVLTNAFSGGRGASVDVSSDANIHIIGGSGSAPAGATVVLNSDLLSSWGAESLLIGGLRRTTDTGTSVDVRTSSVTLNNPGGELSSPEITLASKAALTVTAGSQIASSGTMSQAAEHMLLSGDGTLLRVSGDTGASIARSSTTGSVLPVMTIGAGASISGAGVILDSSYATSLSPTAILSASALALGGGQISIVLSPPSAGLAGAVVSPHLTLDGSLLAYVQSVDSLALTSYRTIDFYGAGTFGDPTMGSMALNASGIRGYDRGTVTLNAGTVTLANPSGASALAAPALPLSGDLRILTSTLELGANAFSIAGYQSLSISASGGLLATADGSLTLPGTLSVTAPKITGLRGVTYNVAAAGSVSLFPGVGTSGISGGLGASLGFTGSSILANTAITLPSGHLVLHALGGGVTVGGELTADGTAQAFYDITRYADAGRIELTSDTGSVILNPGSLVSVAAAGSGGNAGSAEIRAASGSFVNNGALLGSAASGFASGSFLLDAGSIVSFANINNPLESGGFFAERNIRVRTGSVTIDGTSHARSFSLSTDLGSITVSGTGLVDASGLTGVGTTGALTGVLAGGSITLAARDNVTVQSGALLTVAAAQFSSAGKGGDIQIEAGAQQDGTVNAAALLDLQSGATLDLSVASFVAGSYTTVGSSAFNGQFQGTLHLRAPRSGNDVRVDPIESAITGASSVVVEAYKLYDLTSTGGTLNTTLRGTINTDAAGFMTSGEAAMRTKLLTTGDPVTSAALSPLLVIAPGVEIINRTGDLTLGLANTTGSTNAQALSSADWDLSAFRYGANSAPGILTLRAKGDLVFNNTLSDGFTPVTASTANGNSAMWLATLKTINSSLPLNTQSWSFRLSAGADLGAADFRSVLPAGSLAVGKGSLLVGEFYPAIPNNTDAGTAPAVGSSGLTANSIRISTDATNRGTRYEVIRTGTGDITISVGRDVQLRNQFATIYTAGVALPTTTAVIGGQSFTTMGVFQPNDFVVPILNKTPSQSGVGVTLGAIQQTYAPVWSLGGGDVSISAQANIGHYTIYNGPKTDTLNPGDIIIDSSRQMPANWLYRRGYVDDSGQFASNGGIDGATTSARVTDPATSTAWWIDFSNFFEGVGALGGGDVTLAAGKDIVNVDAFAPTNARMAGRDPLTGINLKAADARLLELGGGDVSITAGNNIDGGVYYVERGAGILFAGGSITTNFARSPQLGILDIGNTSNQFGTDHVYNSATWLPTTLFVGKSHFDVSAMKDVLLGPVTNPFLLPQGLNNKFWYKTYFNTFSSTAGVDVASFGGGVTFRMAATMPGGSSANSILNTWFNIQNLFNGAGSAYNASNFQPWLRLAETDLSAFQQIFSLEAPNLKGSAFSGDVNIVGPLTLFPSATGALELVASGSIVGLQSTGDGVNSKGESAKVWTSSTVNVSDADPLTFPGTTSPIAYQKFVGRVRADALMSNFNPYSLVNVALQETGSLQGSSIDAQRARHSETVLHTGDSSPIRLYAAGGSITGLTLFSPKVTLAMADTDITDIAFYIQNVSPDDVSIVAAGRDIIPYNENAPLRSLASDALQGNFIGDPTRRTSTDVLSNALSGDIQINGHGVLEVLAGRDLDLGTGPNYADGTAVGITSIGNQRNPFLPFAGADIVAMAGVEGQAGGAALGLAGSNLDFTQISSKGSAASKEMQDVADLKEFFALLRQAADEYGTTGSYATGFSAIDGLFGKASGSGDIYTRARDIRTTTGGAITVAAPSGGLTMASDIFGNPETPPGIVTEYGGEVSIFTNGSVNIGRTRIFTLRGGDMTIWSSTGDIAAGTASKTVVTAPPTRVVIDSTSADVATDLGGLATGGGIGVLASVKGVPPGNVSLIAPVGTVDAGDAGIQATGNLRIAASQVLNADNIAAGGTSSGVPSAPAVAAPNVGGLTSASSSSAAANSAANQVANQSSQQQQEPIATPSIITVEVLGYGGSDSDEG